MHIFIKWKTENLLSFFMIKHWIGKTCWACFSKFSHFQSSAKKALLQTLITKWYFLDKNVLITFGLCQLNPIYNLNFPQFVNLAAAPPPFVTSSALSPSSPISIFHYLFMDLIWWSGFEWLFNEKAKVDWNLCYCSFTGGNTWQSLCWHHPIVGGAK